MSVPVKEGVVASALLLLCWSLSSVSGLSSPDPQPRGRLLRVPKVYNALITSNEPLLPSRTEQATVGQVLYYPPAHTYPASSGPLILPQVASQAPPLFDVSQSQPPHRPQSFESQQLVSLQQQQQPSQPHLELNLQSQDAVQDGASDGQQSTPWPIVYASDVQQQQQQQQQPARLQQYVDGVIPSQPERRMSLALSQSEAPSSPFPAARAVQTVEHVAEAGEYQPPPAVHIDSVKNNRPTGAGIRDVPPPPLPVGRGRKNPQQPLTIPPGILPF